MGLLGYFNGFGGRDMAVDLGTANTLVYVRGRGIVLSEPSVVAIDQRTGEVHAVGVEAKRMLGRTPGTIQAIRPLKDGVIADFDVTEQMLRHFIQTVHQHRFAHPRVVVCVPSGVTGVEKRAVEEATLSAGARQAYLIEEPMAAAIGAGLPVSEPTGNMIVDIGGGTTEVAIISLGGIVVSQSMRVGGDEMDEAIIQHIKTEYKLLVGQQTAEEIKLEVGSAFDLRDEVQDEVRGRDMLTGLPKTVILSSEEVRRALDGPVTQIVDAIKSTLDKTPPELAADIMDRGIVLAGGGALRRRIVAGVLVLLSIALITIYFRESSGGGLHQVQSAGATVLHPFEIAADRVSRPFRDAYGYFAGLVHAKSQNNRLRHEVEQLRQRETLNLSAASENSDLRKKLHFINSPSFPRGYGYVTAPIIAQPQAAYQQQVTIGAGSSSGIRQF